jgi:hypothetical protein
LLPYAQYTLHNQLPSQNFHLRLLSPTSIEDTERATDDEAAKMKKHSNKNKLKNFGTTHREKRTP